MCQKKKKGLSLFIGILCFLTLFPLATFSTRDRENEAHGLFCSNHMFLVISVVQKAVHIRP